MPEFGDYPPSPWDSEAERTLSQLQSPQPPIRTPPPTPPSPAFPPPPPLTPASPIPFFTPHPAEVPTSPPRKIVSYFPTPALAAVTDPLTPRTEQLLRLPLGELNNRFDMGWSRYLFAVCRRGQVQTWQRGETVSRVKEWKASRSAAILSFSWTVASMKEECSRKRAKRTGHVHAVVTSRRHAVTFWERETMTTCSLCRACRSQRRCIHR